jgi:hypothetical protein
VSRALRFIFFVPLCLLLAACSSDPSQGYAFRPARQANIHTVCVPVFDNQSYFHGLENQLTEAIVKEIQRETPWVVVTTGTAQSTLTGSITDGRLQPLSTSSATGMVMEQGVELTVDFEWRDSRTGEVLVSRKNFKALQSFVPARGTGESLDLGEHAAIQHLARGIVNELRSSW